MVIKYVGKGIEVTRGMKDTTNSRLSVLNSYLGENDQVKVTYELENSELTVTVQFKYDGKDEVISKKDTADNFYALINKISDVIKSNMSKLHGKQSDIEKARGRNFVEGVRAQTVREENALKDE